MIDDLEQLEEDFGPTLRLALHHAAAPVDVGLEPYEEGTLVAVLAEPAGRRPRRLLAVAGLAAVFLCAVAATIVIVNVRRSEPSTHEAVEIAPGWALSSEGPLGLRTGGVFVWDGSGVVVWGGASYDKALHLQPADADGAVYDAATDSWRSIDDAPIAGRRSAKAVWTGSQVVIWGGIDDAGRGLPDGALFDPTSGEWTKMPDPPAGVSADGSAAVWTGTEMLVWGGPAGSKGAAFDPTTDRWRLLPDAPIASRPVDNAVWTDTEMIVWSDGDGAAFDPISDSWRAIAPSPLNNARPAGVWTGSEVVFLGGANTDALTESAAYYPATDTWQMLAPGPSHPGLGFAWTGTNIVGVVKGVVVDYQPTTDTWTETDAKLSAIPFGTWADDRYAFATDTGTSKIRVAFYEAPATSSKPHVPTYDLILPSARLTDDAAGTARGTDAALWVDDGGTYLSLTVIPREPGGPKGLSESTTEIPTFPAARGKAWYGESTTTDGAVTSVLWWEHPDQSVWLMRSYGYGATPPDNTDSRRDQVVQWALDVTTPAEASYELHDPGIQLVGHERAGDRRTQTRIWSYAGQQIVLLVIENSSATEFANLLARGKPETTTIQSRVGYMVTEVGGAVSVGWKADDLSGAWATLTIPVALAEQADDIVHGLRLSG